ncbi:MAG: carbohydrate-binding domain-containing protein [Ruminiclostridium sp.]
MKYSDRIKALLLCTIISAGVLSGCGVSSDTESGGNLTDKSQVSQEVPESGTAAPAAESGAASTADEGAESGTGESAIDTNVLLQLAAAQTTEIPDTSGASAITFSGSSAAVSGKGAEAENGVVTITEGGVYTVSGEAEEDRIIVNAKDEKVTIVLKNAHISCSCGSPIYVYKSELTTIYLPEGTKNTLTDGSEYTYNDIFSSAADEEPNACLYSKSDLVIAGSGELLVNANFNNGITSKDTLRIDGASVSVTAKNNGINGKDSCIIRNAAVKVTSGADGVRSTNDSDSTLGYIVITDSSLDLTAGEDGVQAVTALAVSGGSCNIVSGGGSGGKASSDTSAKGLKGGTEVALYGGSYNLNCCDDAVHSNGNVLISGGSYEISSGDDGIHADKNTAITDGLINISKSYEGIEGASVDISGGTINVIASDDGINAAGGADGSGAGFRRDSFAASSDCYINISGGTVTVDASGDGIDANGSITVSGGEIYVSGPTNNGNGALDYDGTAIITGGVVVAAGSSGMAQNFSEGSTQGSILLAYSEASADTITLKDAAGNILASYTPARNYNCVVISCPDITTGNTYTVEACGQTTSVTMTGLIYGNSGGGKGGGQFGGGQNGGGKPGNRPARQEGEEAFNGAGGRDGMKEQAI